MHKILGAGGFGVVCEATCLETGRRLALKLIRYDEKDPSNQALSLESEYQMLAEELNHPNIISVHPQRQRFTNVFLMEMELGLETLKSFQSRTDLSDSQCSQIMKGIFTALEYLHDTVNVIHRDIKPDNIVITDYDDLTKVKLIDFGLATSNKRKITDFAKCGTLLYTPPEQISNNFAYAKVSFCFEAILVDRKLICGLRGSSCTSCSSSDTRSMKPATADTIWRRSSRRLMKLNSLRIQTMCPPELNT